MEEDTPKAPSWEMAQVEYESAMQEYRHYTDIRRQDLAFVTLVQTTVLTILSQRVDSTVNSTMNPADFILSMMAFLVVLLGINSERRLGAYLVAYKKRASDIERIYGMELLRYGEVEVKARKLQISNRIAFVIYYCIFLLFWIAAWVVYL